MGKVFYTNKKNRVPIESFSRWPQIQPNCFYDTEKKNNPKIVHIHSTNCKVFITWLSQHTKRTKKTQKNTTNCFTIIRRRNAMSVRCFYLLFVILMTATHSHSQIHTCTAIQNHQMPRECTPNRAVCPLFALFFSLFVFFCCCPREYVCINKYIRMVHNSIEKLKCMICK